MENARKLLDQLMGPARDRIPDANETREFEFTAPDVCKHYLIGYCPYQLLANTKADLGNCDKKVHDEAIRKQFRMEGADYSEEYEREFFFFLERLLSDLDRKYRRQRERLAIQPKEDLLQKLNPHREEYLERVVVLENQLKELITKVEKAGLQGRVVEAQDLNIQVEKVKFELEKAHEEASPFMRQEKKMEVCDICGALLVMNDTQRRLDSHFEGRQHNGWVQIRETVDALKLKYGSEIRPSQRQERTRRDSRNNYRSSRPRSRQRSPRRRYSRSPRRRHSSRHHSPSRDDSYRRPSYRSRSRERGRSRSRERGRREYDRY